MPGLYLSIVPSKLAGTADNPIIFSHWQTQPPKAYSSAAPALCKLNYKFIIQSAFPAPALRISSIVSCSRWEWLTTELCTHPPTLNSEFPHIQWHHSSGAYLLPSTPGSPATTPISVKLLLFHTWIMLFHDSITLHILFPPPKMIMYIICLAKLLLVLQHAI